MQSMFLMFFILKLQEATSSLATLARFPWGSRSLFDHNQRAEREDPPMLLQLFEFGKLSPHIPPFLFLVIYAESS